MKNYKFLILSVFIGCISCSQEYSDDLSNLKPSKIETNNIFIERNILNLTSQDAYKVGNLFSRNSPTSRSESKFIKDIQPVISSNGTPLMYLVNYENNKGYVIIGASKNFAPVLAYSEEGNLHVNDSLFIHNEILNGYKKRIEEVHNIESDSLRRLYAIQWSNYESEPEIESRVYSSDEIEQLKNAARRTYTSQGYECHDLSAAMYLIQPASRAEGFVRDICSHTSYEYDCMDVNLLLIKRYNETYGPELKTNWYQNEPYCADAPNKIAGCATIAVGQIMKYHEWPTKFNWNSIRTTMYSPLTSAERDFLNTIRNSMNPTYGEESTSITVTNTVNMLSSNSYTVRKITTTGTTLKDNLATEIKAKYPVFVHGTKNNSNSGHAWVCDGYRCEKVQYAAYMIESIEKDYIFFPGMTDIISQYFHMNIGWGSSYNMWYYLNNVNPDGNEYNSGRGYYSVRPNK